MSVVVVVIFDNDEWAKWATNRLKEWDGENKDVKLGTIGSIKQKGGKVKTHFGRQSGKGAKTGAVVTVIAGVLTGGVGLVGAAAFFKKSVNLTKEEVERIGQELEAGKVALVVTCDDYEVEDVQSIMKNTGGTVRDYEIPAEALDEAAEALGEE